MAARGAFALIVDAKQIKLRAAKGQLHVFVAQQPHPGLGKENLCGIFGARVDFVVAVAAEIAKRSAEIADFVDAIFQRIGGPGYEIAGHYRQIGAQLIGHVHRAAYIGAAHVAAEVNVAELSDLHAVEGWRQVGGRDLDPANVVIQALGGKTVHYAEKRGSAGKRGRRTEKVAARRIGNDFRSSSRRGSWR